MRILILLALPLPVLADIDHCAKKIHYGGAKDEDCEIQVWGMGPATSTPAERK